MISGKLKTALHFSLIFRITVDTSSRHPSVNGTVKRQRWERHTCSTPLAWAGRGHETPSGGIHPSVERSSASDRCSSFLISCTRRVLYMPSVDFSRSLPRAWEKCVSTRPGSSSTPCRSWIGLRASSTMNLTRVDFPEPALPVIQNNRCSYACFCRLQIQSWYSRVSRSHRQVLRSLPPHLVRAVHSQESSRL